MAEPQEEQFLDDIDAPEEDIDLAEDIGEDQANPVALLKARVSLPHAANQALWVIARSNRVVLDEVDAWRVRVGLFLEQALLLLQVVD